MGLFRGAVFRHVGGALKQPIKEPTETPTSTLASMGRFPSLMGRFPTLMGRFTDFVLRGRAGLRLENPLENSPFLRKGALSPGRTYIPPPPSPHFWPKGIFEGRGVGVYILRPHVAGILYAPPFYTPPTPRRVFSGVGGWGCIKFGPVH